MRKLQKSKKNSGSILISYRRSSSFLIVSPHVRRVVCGGKGRGLKRAQRKLKPSGVDPKGGPKEGRDKNVFYVRVKGKGYGSLESGVKWDRWASTE